MHSTSRRLTAWSVRGLAALLATTVAAAVLGAAAPAHAEPGTPAPTAQRLTKTAYEAMSSGRASAAAVEWWHITNLNSQKALAVSGGSNANGAPVIQWWHRYQSNGLPSVEQAWTPQYFGHYVNLRNAGTSDRKSLAIGSASTANGAGAIQWTSRGSGNWEQQWEIIWITEHAVALKNRNSGRCLAMPGGNYHEGTQAIQWTCSYGTEQQWVIDVYV